MFLTYFNHMLLRQFSFTYSFSKFARTDTYRDTAMERIIWPAVYFVLFCNVWHELFRHKCKIKVRSVSSCKFWGFHVDVMVGFVLLGCDIASLGSGFRRFGKSYFLISRIEMKSLRDAASCPRRMDFRVSNLQYFFFRAW